jgi:hypothetical protein
VQHQQSAQHNLAHTPLRPALCPCSHNTVTHAQVAVPHFRRRGAEAPADALAGVPHRKPGQLIKAAMESEAQQAWGQVPLPSGGAQDFEGNGEQGGRVSGG